MKWFRSVALATLMALGCGLVVSSQAQANPYWFDIHQRSYIGAAQFGYGFLNPPSPTYLRFQSGSWPPAAALPLNPTYVGNQTHVQFNARAGAYISAFDYYALKWEPPTYMGQLVDTDTGYSWFEADSNMSTGAFRWYRHDFQSIGHQPTWVRHFMNQTITRDQNKRYYDFESMGVWQTDISAPTVGSNGLSLVRADASANPWLTAADYFQARWGASDNFQDRGSILQHRIYVGPYLVSGSAGNYGACAGCALNLVPDAGVPDGTHAVTAQVDGWGTATGSTVIGYLNVDRNAPQVSLATTATGPNTYNIGVNLFDGSGSGVAEWHVYLPNNVEVANQATGTGPLQNLNLSAWDGSDVVLTIRGRDNAGNWSGFVSSPTIRVGTRLTSPGTATVSTTTPTLNASSAPANVGPQVAYQFEIAQGPLAAGACGASLQTSGWSYSPGYSTPVGLLADGAYCWRARTSNATTFGATGPNTSAWTPWRALTIKETFFGTDPTWPMFTQEELSVNLMSGNLVLAIPGPSYPTAVGAMGVALTYNSHDTKDQGFGPGVRLSVGEHAGDMPARLVDHNKDYFDRGPVGSAENLYDELEVVHSDESSLFYSPTGTGGTYVAEDDSESVIVRNSSGTYTLTSSDGYVYSFEVAQGGVNGTGEAKLLSIEHTAVDKGVARLTTAYNGPSGKVSQITDPSGRTLTFNWACTGAALCVSGPDGITWSYVVTAGKLTTVRTSFSGGSRDLLGLTWDGANRISEIRNANDLASGSTLPATSQNPGYNVAHKVAVSYAGVAAPFKVSAITASGVSTQTGSSTWSFDYFSGGTTGALSNSHQRRTSASGVQAQAQGLLRPARGYTELTSPRQQGQASPLRSRVYYDSLGRLTEERDLFGTVILRRDFNYDDTVAWSESPSDTPTAPYLPTDYTYDTGDFAQDHLLTQVDGPDPDGTGPLGRPRTKTYYDETKMGSGGLPGPSLQGLQAAYFDTPNLAGRLKTVQTDATVNVDWAAGGPAALGGQADNFSVRWSGNLIAPSAGNYVFTVETSGERARLTIDGILAIDTWTSLTPSMSSGPVDLAVGSHKIALEYAETTGGAKAVLKWTPPASTSQVIPASALRPAYGNLTSTVRPSGGGRFRHVQEPFKGLVDYELGVLADGRQLITSYEYDAFGRVTWKVMPKGNVPPPEGGAASTRLIDANGNLQGSPDPTYATTFTYYTPSETAGVPAACNGGTVGAAVNQAGLLKTRSMRGTTAQIFVYDVGGRQIALTKATGTTCSTYTPEGRLSSVKAPGDASPTTYLYDEAGHTRKTIRGTGANSTIETVFDEAGRTRSTIDATGAETTYAYETDGNPTSRTAAKTLIASAPAAERYTTNYGPYDGKGRLTRLADPAGRVWTFSYDHRDALKTVQYPNATFSWRDYLPSGKTQALYHHHGTLPTTLPAQVPADSNSIVAHAYVYDVEGRRVRETQTAGGQPVQVRQYAYNSEGWLSSFTLPNGTVRNYAYDVDTNRKSVTETSGSNTTTVGTYVYDPANANTQGVDQLTRFTDGGNKTTNFLYDADGRLASQTGDRTRTLTWDGWDRATGGTFQGNNVAYTLDPAGNILTRSSGGNLTTYTSSGESPIFEKNTTTNAIQLSHVEGPAGNLAFYQGPPTTASNVTYVYFNDHGDLVAESNNGGVRGAPPYTYDPFGVTEQTPPSNTRSERYTGQWHKKLDTQSGIISMGARPYDPALGRFLSVDPIEGGSANNYDYANQEPCGTYDLSGEGSCNTPRGGIRRGGWIINVQVDPITGRVQWSMHQRRRSVLRFPRITSMNGDLTVNGALTTTTYHHGPVGGNYLFHGSFGPNVQYAGGPQHLLASGDRLRFNFIYTIPPTPRFITTPGLIYWACTL